ncbi:MAG: SprT family zinc-dependent metalloprotease [Candidatus Gracilibacteria bacterium]
MNATFLRTNRRTLCVQIHPEKGLIIRAPRNLSDSRIEKFLKEKSTWINKRLDQIKKQKAQIPAHSFTPGEHFPYLGIPTIPPVHTRTKIIEWYKMKALAHLYERTNELKTILASKTGAYLPATSIRIRSYRSRWGTCSAHSTHRIFGSACRDNTITYNWKIIMAPPEIIDYLVSHELTHLLHKNHGRCFYATLSLLDPNYKAHQKWLRLNSAMLTV